MEKLFKKQTLSQKIKLIQQNGTHLATRSLNYYQVKLYALDKMFIEVWSTRQWLWKKDVKVKSGGISDDFLEPYLAMVQLKC